MPASHLHDEPGEIALKPALVPGETLVGAGRSAVVDEVHALGAAACCHDGPTERVSGWRVLVELSKPRITRLVTMTALGGLGLAVVGRGLSGGEIALLLLGTTAGTVASSAGANTLNQCMEVSRDARMTRTKTRPIPTGRVSMKAAVAFGAACCVVGLAVLLVLCGPAAALVSLATIASYLVLYTPLKPVTVLNTWVGAVPGALPPLIGWSAGLGGEEVGSALLGPLSLGGWSLFALMFVWQIPHFLAIAWMHKEDYARGGYRMLPINDASGTATVTQVLLWAALLVPATMLPSVLMPERVSWVYGVVAGVAGLAFFLFAGRLVRDRSPKAARRVFIASIIHLPILLVALVVDATLKALL